MDSVSVKTEYWWASHPDLPEPVIVAVKAHGLTLWIGRTEDVEGDFTLIHRVNPFMTEATEHDLIKRVAHAADIRPSEARRAVAVMSGYSSLDIADTCDGVEQDAFEEWASSNRYDMQLHPLHWLFLDKRTSAARDGWRAGIKHARERALSGKDSAT